MNVLLDTHIFLWLLNSPEVLPARVLNVIGDRSVTVYLSVVVPWEIAMKVNTGKLEAVEILDNFEAKVTKAHLSLLPTTVSHVIRGGGLPLHHRDPFDRLLIAQSLEHNIPVVSNDQVFELYGVQRIWN